MKKLLPLVFVLGLFLVKTKVNAQALVQPEDSIKTNVKVTAYLPERITFPCRVDSQYPLMPIIAPAPVNATIIRSGYRNQKLQIVSNRNFRNKEMAWKAY